MACGVESRKKPRKNKPYDCPCNGCHTSILRNLPALIFSLSMKAVKQKGGQVAKFKIDGGGAMGFMTT